MLLRCFNTQVLFQNLWRANSNQPQLPDAIYSTRAERGNNQSYCAAILQHAWATHRARASLLQQGRNSLLGLWPGVILDIWGRCSYENNSGKKILFAIHIHLSIAYPWVISGKWHKHRAWAHPCPNHPSKRGHEPPSLQPKGVSKVSAEWAYKSHFISDFLGIAHAAHLQDVLLRFYFKERCASLSSLPKEVKNRDLRAWHSLARGHPVTNI